MVIFKKKKWVDEYLNLLKLDPVGHLKKYENANIPWYIGLEDIVKRVPLDDIDTYLLPKELAENERILCAIFTKNTSGDYCSFYYGDRGETCHYAESPDPQEGFRQYVKCMLYLCGVDA